MRVLVAMSGGVDSSVAAALLVEAGHDVVGATMKLWGGPSDTGCCSVADVDDARRVAQQLGVDHHVFNFTAEFDERVVAPYVADHAAGRTPNPCVECNRSLKFARFLERGTALGFDAVATGHHARVEGDAGRGWTLVRGADRAKDQSYVLHMLGQDQLRRTLLPVGTMTKDDVRAAAAAAGLRTAAKPDSQDVCFIASGAGRSAFLGARIALHPGRVVDTAGREVGAVEAVELVTVGQRKGLGPVGAGVPRYVVSVDVAGATVTVGSPDELLVPTTPVTDWSWTAGAVAPGVVVEVQTSAHGQPMPAIVTGDGIEWARPSRRVAPGQSVVLYEGDRVLGGGRAA